MEQRYKSLSLFDFQQQFKDREDCLKYLAERKWQKGFVCKRCGNTKSCKGYAPYSKQCTRCNYVESPTAQTLFHKVKFDLLKAFYIVYFVSTNKKGITSTELSRKLSLRQKTCWSFKRKVMEAMKSSGKHPVSGLFELDETFIGGQESGVRGRKNKKKKLVVVGIEKQKKGVSRVYARVIDKANAKELGTFLGFHAQKGAKIKTDKWNGYKPLKNRFPDFFMEFCY